PLLHHLAFINRHMQNIGFKELQCCAYYIARHWLANLHRSAYYAQKLLQKLCQRWANVAVHSAAFETGVLFFMEPWVVEAFLALCRISDSPFKGSYHIRPKLLTRLPAQLANRRPRYSFG